MWFQRALEFHKTAIYWRKRETPIQNNDVKNQIINEKNPAKCTNLLLNIHKSHEIIIALYTQILHNYTKS